MKHILMKHIVMKNMTTKALLATGAALLLAGCANQNVNTTGPTDREATPNVEAIDRIVLNPPLDRRVRIGSVYEGETNGLRRIQANVANVSDGRTWFQYRYDWYDADGFVIEGPASAWTRQSILAGQRMSLTGIAPTPNAVDWRLTIRG